jgi:hypothetical protein
MLWRKPVAAATASSSGTATLASASAPTRFITKAPQSLVFRKSLATAVASQPADAPSITPAPTGVIARKPEASAPVSKHAHAPAPAAARDRSLDLDWVTREVSTRLARELEIERERLGVRTWRR